MTLDAFEPQPVTPAEQERAIEVLRSAVSRGLLGLDEFADRTDRALAATTGADLDRALADLPPVLTRNLHRDPLRISTRGTKIKRSGRWTVPAEVEIESAHASVTLDLREAVFISELVTVRIDIRHGKLKLVLPPHVGVDVDGVQQQWGKVPGDEHGQQDGPLLVVVGELVHGKVEVRRKKPR